MPNHNHLSTLAMVKSRRHVYYVRAQPIWWTNVLRQVNYPLLSRSKSMQPKDSLSQQWPIFKHIQSGLEESSKLFLEIPTKLSTQTPTSSPFLKSNFPQGLIVTVIIKSFSASLWSTILWPVIICSTHIWAIFTSLPTSYPTSANSPKWWQNQSIATTHSSPKSIFSSPNGGDEGPHWRIARNQCEERTGPTS